MEMESACDMLAEDPSGRGLKQLREELFEMRTDVKRAVDAAEKVAERVYDTLNR